jgi:hypothetical protein
MLHMNGHALESSRRNWWLWSIMTTAPGPILMRDISSSKTHELHDARYV